MLEVKEGAFFVADAHYASYRPLFAKLVEQLMAGELKTPQLFLMGDVFDLLMGPIKAFTKMEQDLVTKLQELSQKMEVIYLEGNHDFQLKSIFPDMVIYPLSAQPIEASFKNQKGFLAHGDWNEGRMYKIYTFIIRNRVILRTLDLLDRLFFHQISRRFRQKIAEKKLCSEFQNFETYIRTKFKGESRYEGWFIEGHYHQGSRFLIDEMLYHNLEAMACNKSYFVVQSNMNVISLVNHTL